MTSGPNMELPSRPMRTDPVRIGKENDNNGISGRSAARTALAPAEPAPLERHGTELPPRRHGPHRSQGRDPAAGAGVSGSGRRWGGRRLSARLGRGPASLTP